MDTTIKRPSTGKLVQVYPGGRRVVLAAGKPFAVLQALKQRYMRDGYRRDTLKITY